MKNASIYYPNNHILDRNKLIDKKSIVSQKYI